MDSSSTSCSTLFNSSYKNLSLYSLCHWSREPQDAVSWSENWQSNGQVREEQGDEGALTEWSDAWSEAAGRTASGASSESSDSTPKRVSIISCRFSSPISSTTAQDDHNSTSLLLLVLVLVLVLRPIFHKQTRGTKPLSQAMIFFSKVVISPVSWYLKDCDNRKRKLRQSSAAREWFNKPSLTINEGETLRPLPRDPKPEQSTKPTYLGFRV
jgi:hypothetical protein